MAVVVVDAGVALATAEVEAAGMVPKLNEGAADTAGAVVADVVVVVVAAEEAAPKANPVRQA